MANLLARLGSDERTRLLVLAEHPGGKVKTTTFKDGAVARVVVMGFWTRDEAPTLAEFARAWSSINADRRSLLTAEYAYLTDLQSKRAGSDWKSVRKAKAKSALRALLLL